MAAAVDWKQRAGEYFETITELQEKCNEHQIARETAEERSRDGYAKEQRAVDADNHKDRQIRDLQLEKASLQRDVEQLCQGIKVHPPSLPASPAPALPRSPVPRSAQRSLTLACRSRGRPGGPPPPGLRSRSRSHTWRRRW